MGLWYRPSASWAACRAPPSAPGSTGTASIEGFATPGKIAGHALQEGDVVLVRSAGGGGYGDPLDREPERVAADLSDGYISPAAARNLYGVVLTQMQRVDVAATRAQRQDLRAGRVNLVAQLTPDAFEKGAVSRRRVWRLNPADAALAEIGEDDLVELDTGAGRAAARLGKAPGRRPARNGRHRCARACHFS